MKRGSSQLLLRASCFLYVLHGSSLALTFYSPFCWGDTLIYMDLCEPKSFELFKIWRYMDIYEDTLPMGAPSIPNFIEDNLPYIFRLYIIPSFRGACKRGEKKDRPRRSFSGISCVLTPGSP